MSFYTGRTKIVCLNCFPLNTVGSKRFIENTSQAEPYRLTSGEVYSALMTDYDKESFLSDSARYL
jgi:hypothetical protein